MPTAPARATLGARNGRPTGRPDEQGGRRPAAGTPGEEFRHVYPARRCRWRHRPPGRSRQLCAGKLPIVGNGASMFSFIHADDVATAILADAAGETA